MTAHESLEEFLPAYLGEVEELLTGANAQLLAIEAALRRGEANPRAVRDLFRALHTIKGLSAMIDVEPIVAIAHRMETTLRVADLAGGRLGAGAVEPLLAGLRAIKQRLRALAEQRPVPAPPPALLEQLDQLEACAPPEPPPSPSVTLDLEPAIQARLTMSEREELVAGVGRGRRAVRADFTPSQSRAAAGLTINSVRARLGAIAEIVKVVPLNPPATDSEPGGLLFALLVLTGESDAAVAEAVGVQPGSLRLIAAPLGEPEARAAHEARTAHRARASQDARAAHEARADTRPALEADLEGDDAGPARRGVVRVEVARLDDAMERLAAVIVGRSRLARAVSQLAASGVDTRALEQILKENGRLLRDMRTSILRVRMVRVSEILDRLPLIVRGLRRAADKQVRVEVDAGSAELDKAVGERIFPAVVHMVRNAVDHAIEPPDERVALGKPAEGVVRIACHESSNSQLELTVQDDGRGIDRAAVAARAGAEPPATDAALLELLCRPGLSTRAAATTTSGRGMGMDIVRRVTVSELGGALSLATRPGAGTTFTLCVPLSLSIVDAFVFECGDQRFAVPVRLVEEIVEVDPEAVVYGPARRGAHDDDRVGMIERRGVALPIVPLDARLRLAVRGAPARKAVVVRREGAPLAFAVDRMLGQQEIVVRPLGDPLLRVRGIAGATDLGDGQPTLVLDLIELGVSRAARPGEAEVA